MQRTAVLWVHCGNSSLDVTDYRNLAGLAWIIFLFALMPLRFHQHTKRPEYKELLESGQPINLNLLTLVSAWFRKTGDPLRRPHIEIAKIGFLYFFGLLFGWVFGLFVIILLFRLLA